MRRVFLYSILMPLLLISCGTPFTESPGTVFIPGPTKTPARANPPAGYEFVNDDYVDLAFALPEGWTNETATDPGGLISIYYLPYPGTDSLFRIVQFPAGSGITSPEDIFTALEQNLASHGINHLNVGDEYVKTIDGQRAKVMEYYIVYTIPDAPKEAFSIFAAVISPDSHGYILQWSALSEDETELRNIFKKMTPFLSFQAYDMHQAAPTTPPTLVSQNTNNSLPSDCVSWSKITPDYVGQTKCVWGRVKYINHDEDALYIAFGNEVGDFYILAYDTNWTNVKVGDCVKITEKILQLGASPVIVWDEIDKLIIQECN